MPRGPSHTEVGGMWGNEVWPWALLLASRVGDLSDREQGRNWMAVKLEAGSCEIWSKLMGALSHEEEVLFWNPAGPKAGCVVCHENYLTSTGGTNTGCHHLSSMAKTEWKSGLHICRRLRHRVVVCDFSNLFLVFWRLIFSRKRDLWM